MIPPFDENGYLPPGVHTATLAEIAERFGSESEMRRVQMESLVWLIELARRSGIERVVINGSFVTAVVEPNDVDCLLLIGPDLPSDAAAASQLQAGLPFLQIDLVGPAEFALMVDRFFATDRFLNPKGMVEVSSWK